MTEAYRPTGQTAVDGRRKLYEGKDGMQWDLTPDGVPQFTGGQPGTAHPEQVIVVDGDGIGFDVKPEVALSLGVESQS